MTKIIVTLLALLLVGCLPLEVSEETVDTTTKVVNAVGIATGTKIAGGAIATAVIVLSALKIIKVTRKEAT